MRSSLKNPTLRKRTKELSECAEDARECQLLGYELKDLGSLLVKMAIHMNDLQRKVDRQAEYIKTLNEDRKTESDSETPNNCETCKHWHPHYWSVACTGCSEDFDHYEPKDEPEAIAEDINRRVEMTKKEWNARHIEDEPQTEVETMSCQECKHWDMGYHCDVGWDCKYEPKTEPQTEGCPTCKYGRHGNITDEERCDQCSFGTTNNYEPIEPQTDCAWAAPDEHRTVPLYPMTEGGETNEDNSR